MTSERMSEHLESALFANACGDALGWITEANQDSDSLWRIVSSDWLTDFADWPVSAGAGGVVAWWV